MSRIINFEGKRITVPDDATDAEISGILSQSATKLQPGETATNIGPDTVVVRKPVAPDQEGGYMAAAGEGLRRLGEGTLGALGDVPNLAASAGAYLAKKLGADPRYADQYGAQFAADNPLPTSADIRKADTPYLGEGYQPVGFGEKSLSTAMQFLPAAATGGGNLLMRTLTNVAAPAVATEAAGALTNDNPYARLAGALVGGGAGGAARSLISAPSKAEAPSLDLLRQAEHASYDAADNAGVIIKPQGIQSIIDNVKDDFTKYGYRPKNQPGAAEALAALEEQTGNNVTLKGLDTIRKAAAGGYVLGNKTNNALISKVVQRIDEMLDSQDPAHMAGIDTPAGVQAFQMAKAFGRRANKLETVQNLVKKGGQQAGQNITDTEVKSVKSQLSKINDPFKAWGRGFTEEEKQAADKAARYTMAQRLLHGASVLSPAGGGKLSAAGHLAAAGYNLATGNLTGLALQALGIPLGVGFQKAGQALSRKSVTDLMDLIASGKRRPAMPVLPDARSQALISALLASPQAVQGP